MYVKDYEFNEMNQSFPFKFWENETRFEGSALEQQ